MTTTKQDLLKAILEDPADDMRRLVYADFLAENGEEDRAEFIRVQVGDGFGGQYTHYVDYVGMAKTYRSHAGIPEWWPDNWGVQIRRGFVQWLQLPSADWFKHHEAITSQHPIEEVTLTTAVPLQIEDINTGGTAVFNPEHLDYFAVTNTRQEDWTLYYLTHRWPRITFHLPSGKLENVMSINWGDTFHVPDMEWVRDEIIRVLGIPDHIADDRTIFPRPEL